MLQNAYFLAKIGADTAENEQHFAEICQKLGTTLRAFVTMSGNAEVLAPNIFQKRNAKITQDGERNEKWRRQEFRNVSDIFLFLCEGDAQRGMLPPLIGADVTSLGASSAAAAGATRRVVASFWQNFGKMLLVFGCIGTDFCKKICVLQHFSKSTRLSS